MNILKIFQTLVFGINTISYLHDLHSRVALSGKWKQLANASPSIIPQQNGLTNRPDPPAGKPD